MQLKNCSLSLFLSLVVRYALGHLDHVPAIEHLAQVDAKINNLAAGAPWGRVQL